MQAYKTQDLILLHVVSNLLISSTMCRGR